ncbi:MAG: YibE/F family protein [Bacilli bacterium]|nr:YibE/F family protein [Bacilli bacterium]
MNKLLIIILLILMVIVGGKRGIKSFLSLCINFFLLIIIFYFTSLGLNPIVLSILGSLVISYIVLFFVNGKNIKTISSMISVIIVLIILSLGIFIISDYMLLGGFGFESFEEINMFSYDIDFKMIDVTVALVIIGLVGATIDTGIAISTALFEIKENNPLLTRKEMYKSGMNVGKDVLATTSNTLLFAFIGEFMTLLIYFYSCNYSFFDIMNAKVFASEFIKIIFSAIGCILIMPISSYITSYFLSKGLFKDK